MNGLIIAAAASGSGKTTVTLALLGALRRRRVAVAPFKCGPDYLDPMFHTAAAGRACYNLDSWAMRRTTLEAIVKQAAGDAELALAEGVMGLFDGAEGGAGSTAELARYSGWPVVLVIDAAGLAQSAAAVLRGFRDHDRTVHIAGVIFNRSGGRRHEQMLREACAPLGVTILGSLPRDPRLTLPQRHLGLVQAGEHQALDTFLAEAADLASRTIDVAELLRLAAPLKGASATRAANNDALPRPVAPHVCVPPLGQRIAVADDRAFAFSYRAVLDGWRQLGAEILPFSPLANEAPSPNADAVYLPGGYPELHAGKLSAAHQFHKGMHEAAKHGAVIYGECGGFMTLGQTLTDADGKAHAMLGLLPVRTSFAKPRMTLGYRRLRLRHATALGARGATFRGHEFHYATLAQDAPGASLPTADLTPNTQAAQDTALFDVADVSGCMLGAHGAITGAVFGSFLHLVDATCDGFDASATSDSQCTSQTSAMPGSIQSSTGGI